MTDEKRSGSSPVTLSFSPDGGTTVTPGSSDEQLIDLDKTYQEVSNEKITESVEGAERYRAERLLDKALALHHKVAGAENFDPGLSRRNAILGGENFIITVRDKFIEFIKKIIGYVKKAVAWVINKIKGFFGWGKTEERIAFIETKSDALRSEILGTLNSLKITPSCYNVEHLFDSKPKGLTRIETMKYLKTKIAEPEEAVEALNKSMQLSAKLEKSIQRSIASLPESKKKISRYLDELRRKAKQQKITDSDVIQLKILFMEVTAKNMDIEQLRADVNTLYKEFYGIAISDEKSPGIERGRVELQRVKDITSAKISSVVASELHKKIAMVTNFVVNHQDRKLSGLPTDVTIIENMISLNDANFIQEISNIIGPNREGETVQDAYLKMCASMQQYSALMVDLANVMGDIKTQLSAFAMWKERADALLDAYIVEDLQRVNDLRNTFISEGANVPPHNFVIIPPEDATSTIKTIGHVAAEAVKYNVNNIGAAANNMLRQLGIDPGVIKNE